MLNPWIEWPLLVVILFVFWKGETSKIPIVLEFFNIPDPSLKASSVKCVYWIGAAVLFNCLIWLLSQSSETAEAWTSGYILEYTLSIDNLFIFQMIFRIYQTPESQINKALLFGIGGAAILRLIFFIVGTSLFEFVTWIRIPFGILLLYTAYKTAMASTHAGGDSSPIEAGSRIRILELAEKYLPFTALYDMNGKFIQFNDSPDWVIDNGRLVNRPRSPEPESDSRCPNIRLTMLAAVVVALALVDVIFALDAVAAKVAQTHDLFVNFTSSLLAMAGFRSLYFVIEQLTMIFRLLKFGVALVLAYVGIELIISIWYAIPNYISCIVIVSICAIAIIGSLILSLFERFNPIPPTRKPGIELRQVFGDSDEEEAGPSFHASP
jgi:tellurite resistance protein TerC